jgi:hypothetical protein
MSQRHHLVPRFYLEGWKIRGRGLAAIRRSTGEVLSRSPKSVAVETDSYAIDVPNDGTNYVVEKMLSAVESEAANALRNMLATWPPSQRDRESWSLLMALQVTRGRGFRDSASDAFAYLLKAQIALDSRDAQVMRT